MSYDGDSLLSIALLWAGRIFGTAVVALFVFVAVAGLLEPESELPTLEEWMKLALFPIGVCVGYILGWWRQLVGGAVALGCMLAFFIVMAAEGSPVHNIPAFYPFGIPALLYLLYWIASRERI